MGEPLIFCFPFSCYSLVIQANKFTFLFKRFLSHAIRRILNNMCSLHFKILCPSFICFHSGFKYFFTDGLVSELVSEL